MSCFYFWKKKTYQVIFFLSRNCIVSQTARCNTEDDEMGRASSSHSNLTQHAWTRQQLAGKAASRFTEPTYVISRSREHFHGGKMWKGSTAEVTLHCSALKTSLSFYLSLFLSSVYHQHTILRAFQRAMKWLRSGQLKSSPSLECPWRRRNE